MGTEKVMQALLFPVHIKSDVVRTPVELALDIINFFEPVGLCLDPCKGDGVFFDLLPRGALWCEIMEGRDFYSFFERVDYVIGNPPYSHYTAWVRHSMEIANNIIYLMPVYKIFASGKFQDELFKWGGIKHIRRYGTGTQWGFPFGHALAAVHYMKEYGGPTYWSRY